MSENTIFDKILRREIPAQIVHEDEAVLAFRDIQPQAPVHVLVIPKKKLSHFSDLASAPAEDVAAFFSSIAKVAQQLGLEKNGYRVVINNGRDAQQSVEYIHAHILGGRALSWPPG